MAGLSARHIRTDSGRAISLDQRIAELKPLYGIAPDPPKPAPMKIDRHDMAKLSENLDALASGKAVAE